MTPGGLVPPPPPPLKAESGNGLAPTEDLEPKHQKVNTWRRARPEQPVDRATALVQVRLAQAETFVEEARAPSEESSYGDPSDVPMEVVSHGDSAVEAMDEDVFMDAPPTRRDTSEHVVTSASFDSVAVVKTSASVDSVAVVTGAGRTTCLPPITGPGRSTQGWNAQLSP